MSIEDEITKAIGAHGVWKMRLRAAIDTGKTDADIADVAKDNLCAFGKWLYGPTIPAAVSAGADYATARKLHADFHKCAATILECAVTGNKAKADALFAGDYVKASSSLTAAMMKWKADSH
jgi:methyl-accepting chemotaxis protein